MTVLRERFAPGMVIALRPHRGPPARDRGQRHPAPGRCDTADGAGKAARLMRLCDAFGLPLVSLVGTPGIMVGPPAEATGLVRHAARLMVAGSLHEPLLTVGWAGAELGPMGLEGAVRLGFRRELDALAGAEEREARVHELTALAEENAKALNAATLFEHDDVIDRRRRVG